MNDTATFQDMSVSVVCCPNIVLLHCLQVAPTMVNAWYITYVLTFPQSHDQLISETGVDGSPGMACFFTSHFQVCLFLSLSVPLNLNETGMPVRI